MPNLLASISRPRARVYSQLPSASISTLPSADALLPHADMTKASFTARHAIVSTPLALIASAFSTKPGKCFAEQVGVNAPGTANNTTFLPEKSCSVVIVSGPFSPMTVNLPSGIRSPTLIVILASSKTKAAAVRPPRGVSILPVAARSSAPSTRPRRRQLTLAVLLGLDVIDPLPGGLPRTIVARIPDGRLERRQRSVVLLLLREAVAEQHVGLIRAAQASHPQPFASRLRALFPLTELCVRLREHDAELAVVGH